MSNTYDKAIGQVPSHIITGARERVSAYEGRIADFNVAVWLQLPGLANLPVSLVASYRDGNQLREVNIDHGKVSGVGKILLSGIASLPVKVKIEELLLSLRTAVPCNAMSVEELFVQAVEQQNSLEKDPHAWAS